VHELCIITIIMMSCHARTASSMQGAVSDALSAVFLHVYGHPVVDQFSSVYLSSLSRILPYGSRGDVESNDSHPALIPVPALVRIVVSSDHGCGSYVTLRHHAIPRPALHRLFVVAMVVIIAAR
jgi:hypothetical protein